MKDRRIVLSRTIAFSFFCNNVNYNRPRNFFRTVKDTLHLVNAVSVQRSCVFKSKINKQIICKKKPFKSAFQPENNFSKPAVKIRNFIDKTVNFIAESVIAVRKSKTGKITRN